MTNAYGVAPSCGGRYTEAVTQFRRSLVLQPDYGGPRGKLVWAQLAGRDDGAALAAQLAKGPVPPWADPVLHGLADSAFRAAGRTACEAHRADLTNTDPLTRARLASAFGRRPCLHDRG